MEKVKAKKQYGQNFLKDTTILDKIIQSMPTKNNYIVEIGPGLGDLTKNLVKYKDMTDQEFLETKFSDMNAVGSILSGMSFGEIALTKHMPRYRANINLDLLLLSAKKIHFSQS